jgi:hypothetical protein
MREERRLRVLRRIFGRKIDEVTGEWRELHNELHDLFHCSASDQIENNKWAGHVARMGS